jgi:hypothetical protein
VDLVNVGERTCTLMSLFAQRKLPSQPD